MNLEFQVGIQDRICSIQIRYHLDLYDLQGISSSLKKEVKIKGSTETK